MKKKKNKVELENVFRLNNILLTGEEAKLAIILINDYGYKKTTLAREGIKVLADKEGVNVDDTEK